uniref:Putative Erf family protein n=1 Tax=viral metagenome TaxID=1070528 RepID=A0A6M3LKQ9_9ZZZZ
MKALAEIQKKLKAPKGQHNSFGNYDYRSCEDILQAVKPLLGESVLTITDEIVQVGQRYYVKATATIVNSGEAISVTGYAREAESRKGMDESQVTGAASSYARKYALNGLFCIDDTRDADASGSGTEAASPKTKTTKPKEKPDTYQPQNPVEKKIYNEIYATNNGWRATKAQVEHVKAFLKNKGYTTQKPALEALNGAKFGLVQQDDGHIDELIVDVSLAETANV